MQTKINNSYFHSFWAQPFCHLLLPPPFHLFSHDFRLLRSFHGLRMLNNRILYVYARGTLIPALACISGDKCPSFSQYLGGFSNLIPLLFVLSLPYSPSWFVINGGSQRQEGGDSAAVGASLRLLQQCRGCRRWLVAVDWGVFFFFCSLAQSKEGKGS